MNLSRHGIAIGLAALSLGSFGAVASPALAKGGGDGGGDVNNTVGFVAPGVVFPVISNSGGGGGGGKPNKCFTVSIDPVTGIGLGVCTTNRI
jgi:hypothetical protein